MVERGEMGTGKTFFKSEHMDIHSEEFWVLGYGFGFGVQDWRLAIGQTYPGA